MRQVVIRVYEELNCYLPESRRKQDFEQPVISGTPVGQIVADLGLPAAEVDLLLVNGEPAGLEQRLNGGERVSAYPVFESFDVSTVTRVRTGALRTPRFALPAALSPLARRLEDQGFTTRELRTGPPPAGWIMITGPGAPAPRGRCDHHLALTEDEPQAQLRELLQRMQLD